MEDDTDLKNSLKLAIERAEKHDFTGTKEMMDKLMDREQFTLESVEAAHEWATVISKAWSDWPFNQKLYEALKAGYAKSEEESDAKFCSQNSDNARDLLSKISEIKGKLEAELKTKQEDLNSKFAYIPKTFEQEKALDDYEEIGRQIRAESPPMITKMKELAEESYAKISTMPSFIVCASSGTGKTQLPFTLDIPLLYFMLSTESQPIYEVFYDISLHFKKLLDADFDNFYATAGKVINLDKYSLDNFILESISSSSCKFHTPGFLIALIENILNLRKNSKNKRDKKEYSELNWPRLQLMNNNPIPSNPMIITIAKGKINDMCRTNSMDDAEFVLPLIFMDEFNVNENTTSEERARYSFYRNLIRACKLIPVLMGTNSQITNMIAAGKGSGCVPSRWAYVFYKLPSYPDSQLKGKLDKYLSVDNKFKELMLELLRKERPLFINAALEELKQFTLEMVSTPDQVSRVFDQVLFQIQKVFIDRKLIYMNNFFRAQIFYFENGYQMRHYNSKDVHKKEKEVSRHINSHLAFLNNPIIPKAPEEQEMPKTAMRKRPQKIVPASIIAHNDPEPEFYFELYRVNDTLVYYEEKYDYRYEAKGILPIFSKGPLSCMAFSKNHDNDFCALRSKENRFTAFQAVVEAATPDPKKTQSQTITKHDGAALERIVNLAFMISTHSKGLKGMPFVEWFPFFIQQLGCYPSYKFEEEPKKIDLGSGFPFEREHIPYFAFNCCSLAFKFEKLSD